MNVTREEFRAGLERERKRRINEKYAVCPNVIRDYKRDRISARIIREKRGVYR